MLHADELKTAIEAGIPGSTAEVVDVRGTGDHFDAVVVAPAFTGLGLVDQHRIVHRALKGYLDSDELHAFHLITRAPSPSAGSAAPTG
ncbi:MAG TPA: BolA/IbaG family iron-sulfur metabolism protein [Armatimonadota bacterium]|jgi:stress-induced morphogen